MLKEHPDLAPWRPPAGITPRLSDAGLVTLAPMGAIPGYTCEARWLRHARARLRHLFPCLPQQPGCNKRLRIRPPGLMRSVNRVLATTSVRSEPRCNQGVPATGSGLGGSGGLSADDLLDRCADDNAPQSLVGLFTVHA
jgi:hypothetical protein